MKEAYTMSRRLYLDIETRSRTDVKMGVYRYAADPEFSILMAAYSLDGAPVQLAVGDAEIRQQLGPYLADPQWLKVAHNAAFERVCLSVWSGLPEGTYFPPEQWEDTMALAAEMGYPQKLEDAAKALGGEKKDTAGTRLINTFCVPNRKGDWTTPEDKPEEWRAFCDYCVQDVATLVDLHARLGGSAAWPPHEWELYCADQRINDRGIAMDRRLAHAAVEAAENNQLAQELELMQLTGVRNPGSVQQLIAWLQGRGVAVDNLRAETVQQLLQRTDLPDDVHRMLQLRQDLALVASKKYITALGACSGDGRLRGSFRFFGAHTGRWAGRGVQLHNLPRAALANEAEVESAIQGLYAGQGASAYTLKALVRALFTGPFVVSDYSAIEARVVAWLAGEQWVLDAFNAGRDIYVETAARMFNLEGDAALARRRDGKVAVLALGYNGGIGSLKVMGAEGTKAKLQQMVDKWRQANPAIVDMWAQLDAMFLHGGTLDSGLISVERDGGDRLLRLPSGRAIAYHGVQARTEQGPYGPRKRLTFLDPRKNWLRVDTYGGRLTENVTQAVARDVLGAALVELEARGFSVVGHVHDEVIVEATEAEMPDVVDAMCDTPAWATGLPVAAEAFYTDRYRKD